MCFVIMNASTLFALFFRFKHSCLIIVLCVCGVFMVSFVKEATPDMA